jgi:hypothetical protein
LKGTKVPAVSQAITISEVETKPFDSESAGIFLFTPFIEKLNISNIIKSAGLPGTKMIPATSYFLSFLALKLIGTERYAHMDDHGFDAGLGLFARLNVLPKCSAMSSYSYGLDYFAYMIAALSIWTFIRYLTLAMSLCCKSTGPGHAIKK